MCMATAVSNTLQHSMGCWLSMYMYVAHCPTGLEVPEQALDGIPLGFGIIVEDKPFMSSKLHAYFTYPIVTE